MVWKNINEVLPTDKQKIIVYDEALKKELHRTFYLEFWKKINEYFTVVTFVKNGNQKLNKNDENSEKKY